MPSRASAKPAAALEIPVVSGNVSLYNDTGGTGIDPTVVIGMVGLIDDVAGRCTAGFRAEGDLIALVGPIGDELDGSEYQRIAHGINRGDRAASSTWISSAGCTHSCSMRSRPACSIRRTTAPRAASPSRSRSRVCWAT